MVRFSLGPGQKILISPGLKLAELHTIDDRFLLDLELAIDCGSGTYVRSIGRDLGRALGCGAIMSGLVRTRVGPYRIADALQLDQLTPGTLPHAKVMHAVELLGARVAPMVRKEAAVSAASAVS